MKQYYYAVGDDRKGPVTLDELKAVGIGPDTLVWYEGMDNWAPAITLVEFTDFFNGNAPSAPSMDDVSAGLEDAASTAGDAIDKAGDAAQDFAAVTGEKIGDAVDEAGDVASNAVDTVEDALENAVDSASDLAHKAGDLLGGAADQAGDLASGAVSEASDMAHKAGDMLGGAANKAGGMATGAGAAASGAMAGAAGAASGAFGKASGALSSARSPMPPPPPQGTIGQLGIPPKTWLLESILATVICCLPLGIVGIINASKVESRFYEGNLAEAERLSKEAGKWTKIALGVGIAMYVLIFLFYGAIIVAALNS